MNVQQDMATFEKLLGIFMEAFKFPESVVRAMLQKYETSYSEDKALRQLLRYAENGHDLCNISTSIEAAEDIEQRLYAEHIPFKRFDVTNADGSVSANYTYRDCDKYRVDLIAKVHALAISNDSAELTPREFKELCRGRSVGIVEGLTLTDLYSFRENAKRVPIKFVVVAGPDNTYKIYADDKKKLENVMVNAAYDMAGDEKYRLAIDAYTKKLCAIEEKVGGDQPLVIFDRQHPERFMTIDKDGFSVHLIKGTPVVKEDGSVVTKLQDSIKPHMYIKADRARLPEFLSQFKDPIMVPMSEFPIDEVDAFGKAYLKPDFMECRDKLIETYEHADPCFERYPRKSALKRSDYRGLVQLPEVVVAALKQQFSFIQTDGHGNISFPKEYEKEVNQYMRNLYAKLPPFEALGIDWISHGRTGGLVPDFTAKGENFHEFCVLNVVNEQIIDITADGFTVSDKDNQVIDQCSNTDERYQEALLQYINEDICPTPIVMSAEEMQLDGAQRMAIREERLTGGGANEAIDMIVDRTEREKSQLFEATDIASVPDMSEEQDIAVKQVINMHIISKIFSGTELSDINHSAINKVTTHEDIVPIEVDNVR